MLYWQEYRESMVSSDDSLVTKKAGNQPSQLAKQFRRHIKGSQFCLFTLFKSGETANVHTGNQPQPHPPCATFSTFVERQHAADSQAYARPLGTFH